MKNKSIIKILIIVGLALILIDQISKVIIKNNIKSEMVIIPNNTFSIAKVENEGIAFGLNKQNIGNIVLSVIVLIFVINYIFTQKERLNSKIIVYLTLIISGGISNVIDRIYNGAVIDFIKIGNFPVFNFADIFIVCGWLLFAINFIKESAIELKAIKKS